MRTRKTIYRHMPNYSVTDLQFLKEHGAAIGPLGIAAKVALECMGGQDFHVEQLADLMGCTPEEAQAGAEMLIARGLLRYTDDGDLEVNG